VNIIFEDEAYGNSSFSPKRTKDYLFYAKAISEGRKEIARDLNSQVRYRRNR
jgi:hypothetical protein